MVGEIIYTVFRFAMFFGILALLRLLFSYSIRKDEEKYEEED